MFDDFKLIAFYDDIPGDSFENIEEFKEKYY